LEETREVHSRDTDVTYRSGLPIEPQPRIPERLDNSDESIRKAPDMGAATGCCIKRQRSHSNVYSFFAMQSSTVLAIFWHNSWWQRNSD